MAHSGRWESRMKMAWSAFYLGAGMCVLGAVGEYQEKNMTSTLGTGGMILTLTIGTIVAGKVAHDKNKLGGE